MIAYLASDLLWASKIKGAADALGLPCRPVRTMEMLEARLGDSDVRGLVVDLEANAEIALAMIRRAKAGPAPITSNSAEPPNLLGSAAVRVVAFGPHVERERLQAARDAGADDVMPRGAFAAHLEDVLLRLAGRG
jgi:hypothetical protein